MVKLADALDSKSCGLIIRVGSSPTAGTKRKNNLAKTVRLFFYICRATACSQARAHIKNKTRSVVARLLLSAAGGMKYRRAPIECRRWHEIPPSRDIICILPLAKLYMRLLDYSVKLLCFYHSVTNTDVSLNILR